MTRCSSLLLSLVLVLSLMLGAGVGGYLRTAHEIAAAGQVTLVICGKSGAETLTLDRDGNAVDPQGRTCAHCGACLGVADVSLPGQVQDRVPFAHARRVRPMALHLPPSHQREIQSARDPPVARRA
ncbi:hypothetical protein [Donghicola mangrovi]|uniref:DUF2946 domain-containing protein n=1 Tax=Donghicola mangrovi TaxID=2729614 RepID=A0A850QEL4_9RHOB|nr:hypothetical protein [Donghicola mangrovi]NVO25380.1 hypothetical protein [Donghicola mangrovi]